MIENITFLNEYVQTVEHTNSYWMVRTMGGDYFDEFVNNHYIAIGYNEISLHELRGVPLDDSVAVRQLRDHIHELFPEASRPGHIASQLLRFCNGINVGDIVVLPGYSSYRLAVCRVVGESFEVPMPAGNCKFKKRIPVEVLRVTDRTKLSPKAQMMFNSRHPISDITEYASYIDSGVLDFYNKGEETHLLLKVNTEADVTFDQYQCLFEFLKLAIMYCNENGMKADVSDVVIKTQMESPGSVHFISKNKSILFAVGFMILFINGGGLKCEYFDLSTPGIIQSCSDFLDRETDREFRESMKAKLDSLKTDTPADFQKAVIELLKVQNETREKY